MIPGKKGQRHTCLISDRKDGSASAVPSFSPSCALSLQPYRRRERSVPAADRAHNLRKKPLLLKRDPVVPGFASHETLLCSNRVKMDADLNTNIRRLHCLGDSSGWTRGLMMASVMGVLMGREIIRQENI